MKRETTYQKKRHSERAKLRRIEYPERVKFQKKQHQLKVKKEALTRLAYLNGMASLSCPTCKEHHIELLTFEHLDGNGSQHRKEIMIESGYKIPEKNQTSGGGYNMARWVNNTSEEKLRKAHLAILCLKCNFMYYHYGYSYNENGDRVYRETPALPDNNLF